MGWGKGCDGGGGGSGRAAGRQKETCGDGDPGSHKWTGEGIDIPQILETGTSRLRQLRAGWLRVPAAVVLLLSTTPFCTLKAVCS